MDLHRPNLAATKSYNEKLFSFARWSSDSKVVVVASFDRKNSTQVELQLPNKLIREWNLKDGIYRLGNIFNEEPNDLMVKNRCGTIRTTLAPLESQVFICN